MLTRFFLALWFCLLSLAEATERPIIGVLAQELPPESKKTFPDKNSYIPAAYVKAVEAAGARVAPIFINQSQEYYRYVVSSVNGVVLPGGAVNFTAPDGFAAAGRNVLDIAQKLQDLEVSFPILGVCQGYELLMFLTAKTNNPSDILVNCDAKNIALPLNFKPGFKESRLYKYASEEVIEILESLPVTSNHHGKCVTEESLKSCHLDKTWRVLSTNHDIKGVEFISSSEHFHRPLVGVQFHPEKNMFEWNALQANPHSRKAVTSARMFYDWLAIESRVNGLRFPNVDEEEKHLIYNYNPVYTGRNGGYDQQVYLF